MQRTFKIIIFKYIHMIFYARRFTNYAPFIKSSEKNWFIFIIKNSKEVSAKD